jgi:UDPglucose 6-dehydrogenase
MKNQAAIVGGGVTGKATAIALGVEKIFDKLVKRSNITASEAVKFKYLFICVPTPTNSKGCDISYVEDTIKRFGNKHIYIIRSTVIPGTADMLMRKYNCIIISNPEFLTEATSKKDSINPDIIVLGSKEKTIIKDIRNVFYTKNKFPNSEIIETDNKTAEMIKYAINNFYAVKVIFANYLYQICNNESINYNIIKETMYKRKWIGKNHLTVPFRNQFGVRGKCLPKDSKAFAKFSKNNFYSEMVKYMKEVNSWEI